MTLPLACLALAVLVIVQLIIISIAATKQPHYAAGLSFSEIAPADFIAGTSTATLMGLAVLAGPLVEEGLMCYFVRPGVSAGVSVAIFALVHTVDFTPLDPHRWKKMTVLSCLGLICFYAWRAAGEGCAGYAAAAALHGAYNLGQFVVILTGRYVGRRELRLTEEVARICYEERSNEHWRCSEACRRDQ